MSFRQMPRLLCLFLLLGLTGCPDDTTDPVPAVVVAEFDPAPVAPNPESPIPPRVPSPSDMLINPATGLVALPLDLEVPVLNQEETVTIPAFTAEASRQLVSTYLNTLTGFTTDIALETGFSRTTETVLPETVTAETVYVLDVTRAYRDEEVPVSRVPGVVITLGEDEPDRTPLTISPSPDTLWQQGHTYAVVITTGVATCASGDHCAIASSYIFNFLKSTAPLLSAKGRSVCALPDADAAQLEALRTALFAPLFELLESDAAGDEQIDRGNVALAFPFTIRGGAIAINDPTTGQIPTPNELLMTSFLGSAHDCDGDGAKDCQSGQLCLPIDCENDSPAQQGLFQHLNSFAGWPASGTITLNFSRAVDAASVTPESVVLFAESESGSASQPAGLALDPSGTTLTITPAEGFQAGTHYTVLATSELLTAATGTPVRPSTVGAIARLTTPVFAGGESLLTEFGVATADATVLEILRVTTDMLIKAIGMDADRESIAALWDFSIHGDNEALYDPTTGVLPFPNDLLMTLDSKGNPVQVNLPVPAEGPAAVQALMAELNRLDGFSPVAGTNTRFLRALHAGSFHFLNNMTEVLGTGLGDTLSLAVADVTDVDPAGGMDGMLPLMDEANIYGNGEVTASYANGALRVGPVPGEPLPAGRRFLFLAFDNLRSAAEDDEGQPLPIKAAPVFFMARSPDPLVAEGASTVSMLDDESAAQLEQLRLNYDPILAALEDEMVGIPRERILMLWTVTTQTIGTWLLDVRKELDTLAPGLADNPGTLQEVAETSLKLEFADKVVLDGRFAAFGAMEPVDLAADPPSYGPLRYGNDGQPDWQATELPFMLLLPVEEGDVSAPFPVVILQHGLWADKEQVLSQADRFLEAGYAVISMDLPLHGERAAEGQPSGTGYNSADVVASRDHTIAAALDIVQLIRFVTRENNGLIQWLTQELGNANILKTNDLYFVGNSLGAMAGVLALAVTKEVKAAALVVPGGHLTRLFAESPDPAVSGLLAAALESARIEPGSAAYEDFLILAQTLLDRADPVNYARHLQRAPLGNDFGAKTFILTAGEDGLIPKGASDELACAARAGLYPYVKEYPGVCHGFFFAPCDGAKLDGEATQAAADVLTFLAGDGSGIGIAGAETGETLVCDDSEEVTP